MKTLREELRNFKIKVNISTGHDSYEAWREGDHDDLVLAAALCAWGAGLPRDHRRPRVRTFLMPFEKGCALDQLYKAEKSRPITDDHYTRELREDAVYRLVAIMELNAASERVLQ